MTHKRASFFYLFVCKYRFFALEMLVSQKAMGALFVFMMFDRHKQTR